MLHTSLRYLPICRYAKLFRHIIQDSDKTALQKGVNTLQEWTQEWILNLMRPSVWLCPLAEMLKKAILTIF